MCEPPFGGPEQGLTGHVDDDTADGRRPAVLLCHEGGGLDDNVKQRAERLAERGYVAFALVLAGVLGAGTGRAGAQSAEAIARYDVAIQIQRDGSILVREVIDYDFGVAERHGIFRDVPTTLRYDDAHDRSYPLDVVSVTGSPGTPVHYEVEDGGAGTTRIRIGDPDRTITGRHTYVITYSIGGALNGFPDHDELYWNAVGQDWAVPIRKARVTVSAPGPIERIACYAGPAGSNLACERNALKGEVRLSPQLKAEAAPDDTVFIFARAA